MGSQEELRVVSLVWLEQEWEEGVGREETVVVCLRAVTSMGWNTVVHMEAVRHPTF